MTMARAKSTRWRDRIVEMVREAQAAAHVLAQATTDAKNAALTNMGYRLESRRDDIIAANEQDLAAARDRGMESRLVNRLAFGVQKIAARARAVREIAALPDPVGEVESLHQEGGLRALKRRVPIGVIAVIYEARPHVTVNAGALCLKAGNAVLLKGGSEALRCNCLLGDLWQEALAEANLPVAAIQVIGSSDRRVVRRLLSLDQYVDLIVPRGGPKLIEMVMRHTRIPVIKHSHGICHVYVDASADLEQARAITLDSKTYAPAVCNALETLLVHQDIADAFLPLVAQSLTAAGVIIRGCERTRALVPSAQPATEQDWETEYLDLILAVRVVESLEQAVAHIARYGSGHTDAIVSADRESARRFVEAVDSGVVLVNASTMLNDGSRLGMGAEIGISSDRIHARGPMGLRELTCQKWVIEGDGNIFGATPAKP